MLANLGVEMLDQTSYEKKVARMEGLEGQKMRDQVKLNINSFVVSPTLAVPNYGFGSKVVANIWHNSNFVAFSTKSSKNSLLCFQRILQFDFFM